MADPYYSVDTLRNLVSVLPDAGRHSDELIAELIAEYEDIAERARGVAYRHREATFTTRPDRCSILLPHLQIVSIDSVSIDGEAWTTEQVEAITFDGSLGMVDAGGWWGSRATIGYTHGLDAPPPAILRGCREFARARALAEKANAPRNAISWQDDSGWSYRTSTADWAAGRYTGIMAVDDAINSVTDYRVPGLA